RQAGGGRVGGRRLARRRGWGGEVRRFPAGTDAREPDARRGRLDPEPLRARRVGEDLDRQGGRRRALLSLTPATPEGAGEKERDRKRQETLPTSVASTVHTRTLGRAAGPRQDGFS